MDGSSGASGRSREWERKVGVPRARTRLPRRSSTRSWTACWKVGLTGSPLLNLQNWGQFALRRPAF
eukprot:11557088-Alexandrium_andersonii.AAC.1